MVKLSSRARGKHLPDRDAGIEYEVKAQPDLKLK